MKRTMNKKFFERNYLVVPHEKAPVLTIGNHKGGVGKSFVARAMAAIASYLGLKVLIVDLDTQRNCTALLAPNSDILAKDYKDTVDFVFDRNLNVDQVVFETKIPNVFIMPSSIHIEDKFVGSPNLRRVPVPTLILKERLEPIRDLVDLIIIDTAPSANILNENAYAAATHYLYVHDGNYESEMGIMTTQAKMRDVILHPSVNPTLEAIGILYNKQLTNSTTHKLALQTPALADIPVIPHFIPQRQSAANASYDSPEEKYWVTDIFSTNTTAKDIDGVLYEASYHVFEKIGILQKVESNDRAIG